MSIAIGGHNFEGPFTQEAELRAASGVYAILGSNGGQWSVVDIGESGDVQERVKNHDRAACWRNKGYSTLAVAALYVSEVQRMRIEQLLRQQFTPPCGER